MDEKALRERVADTLIHAIDGGAVVFDDKNRDLFALNASAAYVWLCLQHGLATTQIETEFAQAFGGSSDGATAAVGEAYKAIAHLPNRSEWTPRSRFRAQPFSLAGASDARYLYMGIPVRLQGPAEAITAADTLLVGCRVDTTGADAKAGTDRPGLDIHVERKPDGWFIQSSSRDARTYPLDDLIVELEQTVVQSALQTTRHLLTFHAASSSRNGRSVLLTAPSGSGKTTMSTTLAAHGWQYGCDELTMFDGEPGWRNVPMPPCVKRSSYPTVRARWPQIDAETEWSRYDRRVKYLPIRADSRPLDVTAVVFPRYDAAAGTALVEVEPMAGLTKLLEGCIYMTDHFGRDGVEKLLAWHKRARYFTLEYSDAAEACRLLGNRL